MLSQLYTKNRRILYAAALTVEDFMIFLINISASNYLSQILIQFIFHVYESSHSCVKGPIKVQYANATVDSKRVYERSTTETYIQFKRA